jgi:hypothetical protein
MRAVGESKWSIGAVLAAGTLLAALSGATAAAAAAPFKPAGYVSNVSGTASHQLTSRVKVPTLTCKKLDTASDLLSTSISGTLGGSTFDAAGVIITMACSGTTANYSIFGVVDGSHTTATITANAGDVVNVAVIASPTFETASFSDTTTGQGTYVNGTGFTPAQASVDVQGGTGSGHFPKFRPVTFSGLTIDNKALGKSAPTAVNQIDGGGATQISVGPLTAYGKAFTATYITNT